MLKLKLVFGAAVMLFGASANAGLIADALAKVRMPPKTIAEPGTTGSGVSQIVSAGPGNGPGNDIIIESEDDLFEAILNTTVGGVTELQSAGSSVTQYDNPVPIIEIPALDIKIPELNIEIAAIDPPGINAVELNSLPAVTSQTVPAPPVLWLFITGLIGLIGFSKQRKAA